MVDIIAKIMLLLFGGAIFFLFMREVVRESKRSKIAFEKHQEFETMVVHHLGNISEQLWLIKRELQMLNTYRIVTDETVAPFSDKVKQLDELRLSYWLNTIPDEVHDERFDKIAEDM